MAKYCRCGCGVEIPPQTGPGAPRKWATDNCRKRFWDEANGRLCEGCGQTWLNAAKIRDAAREGTRGLCRACHWEWLAQEHEREVQLVARLYNEGLPLAEIATHFNRDLDRYNHPGVAIAGLTDEARKRGLIGYRYAACAKRAAA